MPLLRKYFNNHLIFVFILLPLILNSLFGAGSALREDFSENLTTPRKPEKAEIVARVEAKTPTVEEVIVKYAVQYNVNPNLAIDLATFETAGTLDPEIQNYEGSSATGLYQFVKKTWASECEGDVTDPVDNTRCAMRLLAAGDIRHWTIDRRTRNFLITSGYVGCWNFSRNECFIK